MNKTTVGTCGNCGGAVSVDTIYWSVVPPVPRCERCGSTVANHGPVLDMNRHSEKSQNISNSANILEKRKWA